MTETSASYDDQQKVWDLIKDIQVALMVTTAETGQLHGRPMAAMNTEFDGDLWFASRDDTPKLDELGEHKQVLLAYCEPKSQDYVSVSGRASVVRDRSKIKDLWRESMRVWFPDGPDDPAMVLIRVQTDSAEYWDAPSKGWVYAVGYAKARLTGEPPRDVGENKIVKL